MKKVFANVPKDSLGPPAKQVCGKQLRQKSTILILDLFPLKICVMETPARMVGPATLEHANVKMDSLVLPVKPMCVMSSIVKMMELALMV